MTSTATRPGGPGAPVTEQPPAPAPVGSPEATRTGFAGLIELPVAAARGLMRSVRTSPGRLTVIGSALVLLTLLTGLVGTVMVQGKQSTLSDLTEHREPLTAASQEVYRSLSDADATAASAFLVTGTEPQDLRNRYDVDIARAGAALAKAASDAEGVADAAAKVDVISRNLPVYTGKIETARTNNRLGFPVGASYLREASNLMRTTILPAAADLYRIDTARLVAEQDDARGFPWFTMALLVVLLAALIATQVYLTRRTNRLLNIGLVVGTCAMVIALLWGSVALIVQSVLVGGGRDDGSHPVDVLVQARSGAVQARADELLTLVARGDGAGYEQDYKYLSPVVGSLLKQAKDVMTGDAAKQIDVALAAVNDWQTAHKDVRAKDNGGDYATAVKQAMDASQVNGPAASFAKLDDALVKAINIGRQNFLDETSSGGRALTLLAPGVAVLSVVAAAGVTIGIRDRLREYR
ncbi:hypothetical protein FNH05_18590 [Amycolatopsis rhizosphaerae]|uniref:Secreted protein n=1 Tax=Amycolatopsis rhizosphaerae TaxID=2053003 RepID=A0A558CFZ8_9PSEU|nr:hypothetical protein [Amycolatopsis rhizosphaerae]TVT47693.1 hypothetical protein FNH05_18590 [Amycolatopsis rhizosphaerae]